MEHSSDFLLSSLLRSSKNYKNVNLCLMSTWILFFACSLFFLITFFSYSFTPINPLPFICFIHFIIFLSSWELIKMNKYYLGIRLFIYNYTVYWNSLENIEQSPIVPNFWWMFSYVFLYKSVNGKYRIVLILIVLVSRSFKYKITLCNTIFMLSD